MSFQFRLTFSHSHPGFFRFDEESKDIQLPSGETLSLVARDSEKLVNATRYHFAMSSFPDVSSARARGSQLRTHLQVLNAALSLGLQIPTEDTTSGGISAEAKKS